MSLAVAKAFCLLAHFSYLPTLSTHCGPIRETLKGCMKSRHFLPYECMSACGSEFVSLLPLLPFLWCGLPRGFLWHWTNVHFGQRYFWPLPIIALEIIILKKWFNLRSFDRTQHLQRIGDVWDLELRFFSRPIRSTVALSSGNTHSLTTQWLFNHTN